MQSSDKGKLKATLPDIKTQDENNRKLKRKDYNRPDLIVAKKTELEKFCKFNVVNLYPMLHGVQILCGNLGHN